MRKIKKPDFPTVDLTDRTPEQLARAVERWEDPSKFKKSFRQTKLGLEGYFYGYWGGFTARLRPAHDEAPRFLDVSHKATVDLEYNEGMLHIRIEFTECTQCGLPADRLPLETRQLIEVLLHKNRSTYGKEEIARLRPFIESRYDRLIGCCFAIPEQAEIALDTSPYDN